MKKNKVLLVLALIFYLIVPVVLFFLQYSPKESTLPFKISVGSLIMAIFLIVAIKKLILKKTFDEMQLEMANLKAQYIATPTNAVRKAWAKRKIILLIADCLPLILGGVCVVMVAKALEQELITLSGTMTFALISIAIGLLFDCLSVLKAK